MSENSIYALKVVEEWCDEVYKSLKSGEGRFGWSYVETADLKLLQRRIEIDGWDSLTDDEKDCYQAFLLEVKVGDHVVYINLPEWGKCTIAKVTGEYYWKWDEDNEDFGHRFHVDPASLLTFDRNDAIVHPYLRARLKLQSRWWRIYAETEFDKLVSDLTGGKSMQQAYTDETDRAFLSKEIDPLFLEITKRIHATHPNYALETLIAKVMERVPGVLSVKRQGGAGDYGADILVEYEEGLPFANLKQQALCVVQVKSFEGAHWDTKAVSDIERAFNKYPNAKMGVILSSANESTEVLEKAVEKLQIESGKPVGLIIGKDLARFVLQYGLMLIH